MYHLVDETSVLLRGMEGARLKWEHGWSPLCDSRYLIHLQVVGHSVGQGRLL